MQLLTGRTGSVFELAVSPDSRYVVAGHRTWHVWDLHAPDAPPRWLHDGVATGLDFLGPTHLFATTYHPARWQRFDVETGESTELLPLHGPDVRHAAVHPSGRWLVGSIAYDIDSGWPDPRVGLCRYDVTPAGLVAVGPTTPARPVRGVRPQGDGYLAAGVEALTLNEVGTGDLLATYRPPQRLRGPSDAAFGPDGSRLAVRDAYGLYLFDAAAGGDPLAVVKRRKRGGRLAFHPSGRVLATTDGSGPVEFRDPDTLAVTRSFDFGLGGVNAVAFTPDGTRCVVSGGRGKVLLFDVDD